MLPTSKEDIQTAFGLCSALHQGQERRDGFPYRNHPIAVSNLVSGNEEKVVALLHDILEDTDCTVDDLKSNGFTNRVIHAVVKLTKEPGDSYESYLQSVASCKLATKVKIADMFHNISDDPTPKQKAKYFKGLQFLLASL